MPNAASYDHHYIFLSLPLARMTSSLSTGSAFSSHHRQQFYKYLPTEYHLFCFQFSFFIICLQITKLTTILMFFFFMEHSTSYVNFCIKIINGSCQKILKFQWINTIKVYLSLIHSPMKISYPFPPWRYRGANCF